MYVQWLLEFTWRIFIQGPLMVINFFTKQNNISKIFFNTSFLDKQSNILNSIINISSILSVILFFSSIVLIIIFIYKLFKSTIIYQGEITKVQVLETLKEFAKVLLWTLTFILIFGIIFIIFDSLFYYFNVFLHKISNNVSSENGETIENIPLIIYWIITGTKINIENNPNFLFPNNYLEIANEMNILLSIIFVLVFGAFLIWLLWSIFQKMLEIIFLYISFPIPLSVGMEIQQLNWKIWLKEILNKMFLIFVLAFFVRSFLYLFILIHSNIIMKIWNNENNHNEILYMNLFVILALSCSMIFIIKLFSIKNKENIGIIASFKQTKNFIANNKMQSFDQQIKLEPINANVNKLRKDVTKISNNQINYSHLKKVRIFNK